MLVLRSCAVWAVLGLALAAVAVPASADVPGMKPIAAERQAISGAWMVENPTPRMLTADGKPPPLKPAAAKLYKQRLALRTKGETWFDRATWCASPGVPRANVMPYPLEIVMDDRRVAFLYQWFRLYRLVDLSGMKQDVPYPISIGYGMGRWEGETLVIETIGLLGDTTLDAAGLPHSENMTLTERIRLIDKDRLENRMTINDPENYSRVWETTATYKRLPGQHVQDDVCLDRIAAGEPAVKGDDALLPQAKGRK